MSYTPLEIRTMRVYGVHESLYAMRLPMQGRKQKRNDHELAKKLVKSATSHAKFSRGVIAWVEIKMQAGFMIELDTYRHGREVLSTTSSMHSELRELKGTELAEQKQADLVDKVYTQVFTASYQCLRKIYIERRKHRHPDWQLFCDWIETLQCFDWLIMPEKC